MSILLTSGVVPTRAGHLNPCAKITAIVLLGVPLLLSIDLVSSTILLAAELVALPLLGLGPRLLGRYAWPMLVGLGGIVVANLVAGGSIGSLGVVTVRLIALALPGLLLVLTTDPVHLADALVQVWHAPARLAYGALAAFRLIPLLAGEWQSLRRARRARGLDAGRNPVVAVRLAAGTLFALLVVAIRRGIRLAAAMDSRGFGVRRDRSHARPSRFSRVDWAFVAGTAVLAAVAVTVSVGTGHWHFLFA
ncbi:MAG: energy-coupling factor transporter transmembrane component T family protein [Mycobacteriales bacterium]